MRLLYQLISAFQPGGLKSRDGSVKYKELLKECKVPIMAIAGDHDMICPPSAVAGEISDFSVNDMANALNLSKHLCIVL